jgi:hypothetical protein
MEYFEETYLNLKWHKPFIYKIGIRKKEPFNEQEYMVHVDYDDVIEFNFIKFKLNNRLLYEWRKKGELIWSMNAIFDYRNNEIRKRIALFGSINMILSDEVFEKLKIFQMDMMLTWESVNCAEF